MSISDYSRHGYLLKYDEDRSENVVNFINEVCALAEKYRVTIGHEDGHGGFQIEDSYYGNEWFAGASEIVRVERRKE